MTTAIAKTDERRGSTSASNAAADRRCAGRHQAQRGIPDATSEDAAFGQQIHDALAKQNPEGLDTEQLSIYEQCNDIAEKLLVQFFGNDRGAAIIVREQRYWCRVFEKPGSATLYQHSGKLDLLARHGKRVLILEYKTLKGEVPEPSSNEQLRDQSTLAGGNLKIANDCEIGVSVVQPLVTHSPEICIYGPEDLKRAEADMFARVRASNAPDAKRTANRVSCKFCLAKPTCNEYAVWSESLLPATTKVAGVPVSEWTPDMRAYFCEMKGSAQKWLDECEAEMKRLIEADPSSVPGWKLAPGAIQEKVTDPQELFARFCGEAKTFAEAQEPDPMAAQSLITGLFMGCLKVGKGDFEAQMRKVTGLKGKPLKAKLDELLAGVTESNQNKPSLAKMTPAELESHNAPDERHAIKEKL